MPYVEVCNGPSSSEACGGCLECLLAQTRWREEELRKMLKIALENFDRPSAWTEQAREMIEEQQPEATKGGGEMTDGIRDALGMDSKNRENRDGDKISYGEEFKRLQQELWANKAELDTVRQQLQQERERAQQIAIQKQDWQDACYQAQHEIRQEREARELAERERDEKITDLFDELQKVKEERDTAKRYLKMMYFMFLPKDASMENVKEKVRIFLQED